MVVMEDIAGVQNMEFSKKSLYELLKTGDYKIFLVNDYFPEVIYIQEDDSLYMRSTHYRRVDEAPVRYWFFVFDKNGNRIDEVTNEFIRLDKDYSILHVSGAIVKEYGNYYLNNINIIGAYDLSSNKYKSTITRTNIEPSMDRVEYDEEGNKVGGGFDDEGKKPEIRKSLSKPEVLYVPADDTASGLIKSKMLEFMDKLKNHTQKVSV